MKAGMARALVLCTVMVVSVGGTAYAADPQVVRIYHVQAGLDVDPAGQVTKVNLPPEIPTVLVAPAQEAIGHWRFKPPVRQGHPVTARTYAWVTVQLVRRPDGNYGLHASFNKNGPALVLAAPEYPRTQIGIHGEGSLVMEAVVQPDGRLTDIKLVSADFNNPAGRRDFGKAVEAALRRSHALPELVGEKPVATRMRIPVAFHLGPPDDRPDSGKPEDAAAGSPAAAPGEAVALDSPVSLLPGQPSG